MRCAAARASARRPASGHARRSCGSAS
jgi:hypothetical protein